jgi:predicted component of type VI protein secretion system
VYFFELLSQLFDANMHGLRKQVQQVNHLLHRRKKMTTCATGATGESPVATGERIWQLVQQVQQVNHLLHRRKEMTTCATGATGESPVATGEKR